jgi:hypothetical protein
VFPGRSHPESIFARPLAELRQKRLAEPRQKPCRTDPPCAFRSLPYVTSLADRVHLWLSLSSSDIYIAAQQREPDKPTGPGLVIIHMPHPWRRDFIPYFIFIYCSSLTCRLWTENPQCSQRLSNCPAHFLSKAPPCAPLWQSQNITPFIHLSKAYSKI